jgi:hypothetical protein
VSMSHHRPAVEVARVGAGRSCGHIMPVLSRGSEEGVVPLQRQSAQGIRGMRHPRNQLLSLRCH